MPACKICGEALDDFNISEYDPGICNFCAGEHDDQLELENNEDPII